jgi:tetratricopeptide (TPR) repeat protein
MARKKEADITTSLEEQQQAQQFIDQYHHIADVLHTSTDQAQVEAALSDFTQQTEAVQIAILKALSKEQDTDAADILAAVNATSQQKEVRKEARRSLLRLESSKVYPQWTPPIKRAPVVQLPVANPPRFWRGAVIQAREQGEIQLLLSWEQGYDYSEARILIFLLDFWNDGVKDLIDDQGGKRRVDERISEIRSHLGVPVVDCTLAEGRRLLEEALSVNEWRGTRPGKDYREREPLVRQLVFQASAQELGEDRGHDFINPELEPAEVAINFIGGWAMGDYGLTYDLLSENSPLRAEHSRDEWMKLHRNWHKEALPVRLELGFVHEQEAQQQQQSALWLPSSISSMRNTTQKTIEIGWSLELNETPLSGTLTEMPMGTTVNKETGRHWFWTNFTLVREQRTQEVWRIKNISDEGRAIQGLPVAELQKRIKSYEEAIEARIKQPGQNLNEALEELAWRLTQLLHYYDALIVQLPLDKRVYNDAYKYAIMTGNPERTIVYLERMAQRFGENKADTLRRLGATLTTLAYNFTAPSLRARFDHLQQRAEETLREAIRLEDNAIGHILLAEFLLSQGRNDEAEQELLKAKMTGYTLEEEASIEAGLGNIAMRRERVEEALSHFERVAELNPDYTGIWFSIGFAQRLLGRIDAAEESYKRAILKQANDQRPYNELAAIYLNRQQPARARAILEQGLQAIPDSADLHALYASLVFELGDVRTAQRELNQAIALNPQSEIVQSVTQHINSRKK